MKRVYVSGALTGVPNISSLKNFYEAIADLCSELGMEVYVPHLNSDPKKHAGLSPSVVYEMDSHQVKTANLVIAYVGVPSLGVGQELEIAHYEDIPVILLYEAGDKPVSRMARGLPVVIRQIAFTDYPDALEQLMLVLLEFIATDA